MPRMNTRRTLCDPVVGLTHSPFLCLIHFWNPDRRRRQHFRAIESSGSLFCSGSLTSRRLGALKVVFFSISISSFLNPLTEAYKQNTKICSGSGRINSSGQPHRICRRFRHPSFHPPIFRFTNNGTRFGAKCEKFRDVPTNLLQLSCPPPCYEWYCGRLLKKSGLTSSTRFKPFRHPSDEIMRRRRRRGFNLK